MHSIISAQISAVLLDFAIKSTAVCLLASFAALMLRKRSAATRHLLRQFAMLALLLLPSSMWLLPSWHIAGLPQFAPADHAAEAETAASVTAAPPSFTDVLVAAPSPTGIQPTAAPKPGAPAPHPLEHRRPASASQSESAQQQRTQSQAISFSSAKPVQSGAPIAPSFSVSKMWPQVFLILWLVGALALAARWIVNSVRISGLVARGSLLNAATRFSQLERLATSLGIDRKIELLESSETDVAFTTGIFHPAVILPPDHHEWSDMRSVTVLNHELAHIKRLDALAQFVGNLAIVFYWWHPLVWLHVSAMRGERERACDDYVLACGARPSDYAHELLEIVSALHLPELQSALAMARRSQLEGRVLALLDPHLRRGSVSRKFAILLGAATLALVLPLSAMRPAQQQTAAPQSENSAAKSKPSPAQAPAASPSSSSQSKPEADRESEAPEASEAVEPPEPPEVPEPAEAPEPPEPPKAIDGVEAPAAPAAPAIPAIPAIPATPAVPATPAIPAIPAVPAVPSAPASMDLAGCGHVRTHNTYINEDGAHKSWHGSWSGDNCDISVRAEGDIRFNADANAIESISSGGYFEINQRIGDTLRQIKVTPSANGLQYAYKLNGNSQPFEGEARTWFSGFLLALERSTGFSADARVNSLLAKGGPAAVLDEISNLQSDYVRGLYLRKLLEHPNLSPNVVLRIINQSAQQISGDYELAQVLMAVSKQYDLPDETSRAAFMNAAGKLKSDYEHSRVLIELLKRPSISPETVRMGLNSAATINSDYEKSRIALALVEQKSFSQADVANYLKLVSSTHSDYEKSRDLLAPLERYQLSAEAVNQIMEAAAGMSSDYEKSRLLTALAGKGKFDEAQMSNYLKVIASMKSDYERSRSLLSLMQHNTLSPASVNRAIDATAKMGSDYEKSRVLLTLLGSGPFNEAQITNFFVVVDSMKGDYERSRSLTSLLEKNKLSDSTLGKLLEAVTRISSDYEKAQVLTTVSRDYRLEGPLRQSYINAAETIHSEYDRNRALAGVVKTATL